MNEYLQYRMKLRRLRKKQLEISQKLNKINTNAKTQDDYAEASSVFQDEEKITKWIEYLQTEFHRKICQNLGIPFLNLKDENLFYQYDFDDDEGERNIFTTIGLYDIKKLIRQERKEKRESFGYWATIVSGILGILIGLVSAIKDLVK